MAPFRVDVEDLHAAVLILGVLADYDLFQFENNVKPDYSSVQGLEVYSQDLEDHAEGPWVEWFDMEDGEDIKYHIRNGSDLNDLIWEGARDERSQGA